MIVDFGKKEHGREAAADPEHLLGVEADVPWDPDLLVIEEAGDRGVLGVQRGRVDFKHRDGTEQEDQAQQRPVEVAEAQEPAHQGCPSLKRRGKASSHFGKGN